MSAQDSTRRRAKGWAVAAAVCAGLWLVHNGTRDITPPVPSAAQAFAAGPNQHTDAAADPLPPSDPVRLRIPQIDVDAPVMGLGLARDGSLDVPPAEDRNLAGWYEDGTTPGAKGTAIVAGHVDNAQGPAVFYSLGALKKGHRIEVLRADGRTAVFTIDAIEVYEADDFPDKKVYGAGERAELRVITCGGGFSEKTGYQGNVVAYGHLIGVRDGSARKQ
jgi:LPXTG-site transpeptidase (sortase) family protein